MSAPYIPGPREVQADFNTPGHVRSGLDLTRRPDAIILDPLVAYSMGPIALGDASAGPQNRPWRARATATQVLVSRANDANTAWEAETVLFNYAGAPIVEMDLAFEQLARAVIAAERDGEIWVYWFDPILGDFIFQNFGDGRTPRCMLDNPADPSDSDVIVFYFSDS
jgi:hypothetical protein